MRYLFAAVIVALGVASCKADPYASCKGDAECVKAISEAEKEKERQRTAAKRGCIEVPFVKYCN